MTALTAPPDVVGLPRPWRRELVDSLRPIVGTAPVLLIGSRALGLADPLSDCDVAVVLTRRDCARLAPRLVRAAGALSGRLGVPVSVSPLPRARLARPRGSLYLLKVHREAVQLCGRPAALQREAPVAISRLAASSYATSAVVTLLDVAGEVDAEVRAHAARKALLQVAQLRLADRRRYASTLTEALERLGDVELLALAEDVTGSRAFDAIRRSVLAEAARRPFTVPTRQAPRRNLQVAVVSALRGRPSWNVLWHRDAHEALLARALVTLLESGDATSLPDSLLRPLGLPRGAAWAELRDVACEAWRRGHALGGVLR